MQVLNFINILNLIHVSIFFSSSSCVDKVNIYHAALLAVLYTGVHIQGERPILEGRRGCIFSNLGNYLKVLYTMNMYKLTFSIACDSFFRFCLVIKNCKILK